VHRAAPSPGQRMSCCAKWTFKCRNTLQRGQQTRKCRADVQRCQLIGWCPTNILWPVGPLLVGALFGRTCWTCLISPLQGHIVLDGVPIPQRKGRFGGRTPGQNMQLQIAAVTWQMQTKSDSAFYQITLMFVRVLLKLSIVFKCYWNSLKVFNRLFKIV